MVLLDADELMDFLFEVRRGVTFERRKVTRRKAELAWLVRCRKRAACFKTLRDDVDRRHNIYLCFDAPIYRCEHGAHDRLRSRVGVRARRFEEAYADRIWRHRRSEDLRLVVH